MEITKNVGIVVGMSMGAQGAKLLALAIEAERTIHIVAKELDDVHLEARKLGLLMPEIAQVPMVITAPYKMQSYDVFHNLKRTNLPPNYGGAYSRRKPKHKRR